jgi:hypothetical protein
MISIIVLSSNGLSQAVATLATGISSNGTYSPVKGETETLCSVYQRGTVLEP